MPPPSHLWFAPIWEAPPMGQTPATVSKNYQLQWLTGKKLGLAKKNSKLKGLNFEQEALFFKSWWILKEQSELHTGAETHFLSRNSLDLMFQKCEFCEKWDYRNVNFVKNEILERWIFVKIGIFNMWIHKMLLNFWPRSKIPWKITT